MYMIKCAYTKMRLTYSTNVTLPTVLTEIIYTFNCYVNNLALPKTSKR